MILAISAVSAADTNETSDSVAQAVDEAPVEEVASADVDAVASTDNTDVLSAGEQNFTQLQTDVDTGTVSMSNDYVRQAGENTISINRDVTIVGNDFKIDGNNLGGIFNVNSGYTLTLTGVTLINGNSQNGAAVYVNNGAVLIANAVNFIDNIAVDNGGAIYATGATVNLTRCTLDANDVTEIKTNDESGGAAIYVINSNLTIRNSKITNNGNKSLNRTNNDLVNGVLNLQRSTTVITDSLFENNTGIYGGAIIAQSDDISLSSLTISGTNFTKNVAYTGGAIYTTCTKFDISDCFFTDNNKAIGIGSPGYTPAGGAICVMTGSVATISNITVKGSVSGQGGAVSTQKSRVSIEKSTFEDNSVFITDKNGFGGAVYLDGPSIVDNCTFKNNYAESNGGAIRVNDVNGASITIKNVICDSNRAGSGGAIAVTDFNVTISDSEFANNEATVNGGAIYFTNWCTYGCSVNNSSFTDNTAGGEGNAIFGTSKSKISLSNNTLAGSQADIVSEGEVTSQINVITYNAVVHYGEKVNLTATITDDNGNLIDAANFYFVVDNTNYGPAKFNPKTGKYEFEQEFNLALGPYEITMNYDKELTYVEKGTLTAVPKGTYSDLKSQIDTLASGETLELTYDFAYDAGYDGDKFADGIIIYKDLTIKGNGHYIDGADTVRIFAIDPFATVNLNNITFKNGKAEKGGAVYVEANNNLIANNVNFIDNVASEYDGGAIYTVGGTIALTDCVLDGNDVTKLETSASQSRGGAAIYAKDAQVTLVNTNVTNNGRSDLDRSKGDMVNAVINLINSNAAITGGLFENNTGIYGGAIIADGDGSQTLTVSGATFKNNKAYNGGAIDISSMITDISDCTFDNNWVVGPGSTGYYGLGGAVATDGSGSFSLTGSNFTGNKATGLNASAGAVSVGLDQGCTATIDDCVFKENTAELKGGAVFIAGYDDDATVSNCNFSDDNTAEIGGSLYNGGNLKLTNNVIEGDSGIYSSGAGKIDTHVWVIVNDNQDVTVEYYDTIPIVVKITDDNGNLIRIDEPTLTIDLGDRWTRYTLTLDEATGFYTMDNYLVDQKSGLLTPDRTTIQKYFSSYNANTNLNSSYVTMIKANASLEVTYQNVSRPDDVVITINLTGKQGAPKISWAATAATPFKVTVNDVEYKVKITNGIGTLTIPDLPAGEYVVNASWDGNTKYNPIEPTTFILKVSNLNVTEFTVNTKGKFLSDENVTINVTLLGLNGEGLNETFNVIVNNAEYAVIVTNGTGTLNISGLAPGHYSALGIFPGNNNYNGAYATGLFTVLYPSPILNVTAEDITYGEDVILNITLTEADGTPIDGGIGIDVGGKFSLDISINGFASIHVPNLPANESGWAIAVYYYGDDEHLNAQNLTETVKVAKIDPMVVIAVIPDVDTKEPAAVSIFVGNVTGGQTVATATGQIKIEGYGVERLENLTDGIYTLDLIDIVPGDYEITVTYLGDGNFNNERNSTKFTVPKRAATVEITDVTENILVGQNATFTVNVDPDSANGNVTIYINGTESGIIELDDEYANATVSISNLGEGTHTIGVKYKGNDHYNASDVVNITITVAKASSKVTIKPIGELTYGNDVTIGYTVLNATTIRINVATKDLKPVYYDTFDANVSEYSNSFVLPNLAAGEYIVVVENDGNDNYTFSSTSIEFTVNKAETTMQTEITPDIKVGDEGVVIKVVLPENATGKVMLSIDDEPVSQMGYELINGTANITVPADFVTAGKHSYYVSYDGDDNYTSAYDFKSFEVSKVTPAVNIVLNESEIGVAGSALVNITVAGDATGKLLIDNNGDLSIVELTKGNYTLPLYNLVAGEYYINVTYIGDDKYSGANASKVITVPKADVKIVYETVTPEIKYGESATVKVDIDPDFATGNVTIFVDNIEYETVDLDEDYANATISIFGLVMGSHNITVTYNGDENYNNQTKFSQNAITVTKGQPTIEIMLDNDVIEVGSEISVIYGIWGEVNGGNITISIDGVECYNKPINGTVNYIDILSDLLTAGNHTISAQYLGDDLNLPSNIDKVNVTVLNMSEIKINIDTPENTTDLVFSVTLPSNATGYLFVDVDGQHYYAPVKNGTASVTVPSLAPGNYTAAITYSGDDQYDNVTLTKEVSVASNVPDNAFTIPDTAKDGEPLTYSINLPSDAKGYLEVDVDGKKYVAPLENGSASISVPGLSAGDHNVTVSYTGDGKYSPVTKSMAMNVSAPVYKITNNNNVAAIYSANANYKVLITKDGKAVGAGESVVITFNGKKTTVKTDSKGYATLKLNTQMKVKTYTVTAEYKGVKVSNKVTIKHVIKAKNVNVKKSKKVNKIKVKTNKVNGKFLKGKKLTLKIKGKKIKAKINKKGVATFKVKKSVLKKLKVGKKYKYTVTYGKDTVTKKLKVKR